MKGLCGSYAEIASLIEAPPTRLGIAKTPPSPFQVPRFIFIFLFLKALKVPKLLALLAKDKTSIYTHTPSHPRANSIT